MRRSMRENSWQDLAARPLRAQTTWGWCSWAQQHTSNTYRLVQQGVITFHGYRCNNYISLLKVFVVLFFFFCLYICKPVSPSSACSLSQVSKLWNALDKRAKHTSCWVSELLTSQWLLSWFNTVRSWGRYKPSRAADQQPCIYAHQPTEWLSDWGGGWMTDYHSAGGSRTESHSPHRPADSLPGWRDGWMTSLMALPCLLSWCFTCWLCFCLNNWMKDWPTDWPNE